MQDCFLVVGIGPNPNPQTARTKAKIDRFERCGDEKGSQRVSSGSRSSFTNYYPPTWSVLSFSRGLDQSTRLTFRMYWMEELCLDTLFEDIDILMYYTDTATGS